MRQFGPLDGTVLPQVLRDGVVARLTGSVIVTGRGDGGQIWLHDGRIAYAQTDSQPQLAIALRAVGVVDEAGLVSLRDSMGLAPVLRPGVTPDVVAVVTDLTEQALARLLALNEGSWRITIGDRPPLGVLTTRAVDATLAALTTRPLLDRVRQLQIRGQWRLTPTAGKVRLQPREWELLAAMASPASPTDLSIATGWSVTQVRVVLSELASRGLLERAGLPETATESVPVAGLPRRAPEPPVSSTPVPPAQTTPPERAVPPVSPPSRAVPPPTPAPTHRVPAREPVAVGVGGPAASETWTATGGQGNDRAAALRRLIGAVRRL